MTHQEDGDHHTPTCSAFFVPGEVVHAWRRNQKVIDLDRPDDKQVADKVLSLERAIECDTVPPPDKQMIVARKLGEFLTSKKARDVGRAIAPPVAAAPPASSETPMSEDERFLSEIPRVVQVKGQETHARVVSERHDVGRQGQHLFKGETCERRQSSRAPAPRIIWKTT